MLLFITSLLQRDCIRTITSGGKRAEEGHNMAITHNQNSDDKKFIFMVVSLLLKHQQRSPPFLKVKPGFYAILQSSAHPIMFFFFFFCAFQLLVSCLHLLSCHLSNSLTSVFVLVSCFPTISATG